MTLTKCDRFIVLNGAPSAGKTWTAQALQKRLGSECICSGLVHTESVMKAAQYFDLSNSESPLFIGRAVAALAADPDIMQKSGQTLIVAVVAQEYSFTDIDGKQPRPLSVEEV